MAGNKGEWAEPYVALKILGEGKLFLADENGHIMPDKYFDILDVIRFETEKRIVKYKYDPLTVMVDVYVNDKYTITVPAKSFFKKADELREEIKRGKGAFGVGKNLEDFFQLIELKHPKAKSVNKSDIFISAEDPRVKITREQIGFSIKSVFSGNNPTLFNTASASAAIYKIIGCDDKLMETVNAIKDEQGHVAVKERCNALIKNGCTFEFEGFPIAQRANCAAFAENLEMLNPRLIQVIDYILRLHFLTNCKARDVDEMVDFLIKDNPCSLKHPKEKYQYMIKAFLYASYCGLTASSLWSGKSDVNGGFITVDEKANVTANLALESESFKSYLYKHCYFEWPSTGKEHGNYAVLYKEKEDYYFRLNFQIRYR